MGAGHRPKPGWLRSAERQGLVSALNATKWREACEIMRHLPGGPPRYRVKGIDSTGPGEWDREWFYHPRPYELNEWVEIDPDSRGEQVRAALAAVGVPVVAVGELVRVDGWLRPAVTPDTETNFGEPRAQQMGRAAAVEVIREAFAHVAVERVVVEYDPLVGGEVATVVVREDQLADALRDNGAAARWAAMQSGLDVEVVLSPGVGQTPD